MTRSTALVSLATWTLAWLASTTTALACSCTRNSEPAQALLAADAVFAGRVVAIRTGGDVGDEALASGDTEVDLEVLETWKGVASPRVTVVTSDWRSQCGYHFESGEAYLVYAWGSGQRFGTSMCSRTSALDAASEDLSALGAPVPSGSSDETRRKLLEQARSGSSAQRIAACNALALMPDGASQSVPELAALLDARHDIGVRRSAAQALGVLGSRAAGALPALVKMLDDEDPAFSTEAVSTLAKLGADAAPAVPRLLALLKDDVAVAALRARRELLPGDRRDEADDIGRRLDAMESQRSAVVDALGAIGPAAGPDAIAATIAAIRDGAVRPDRAAAALRAMGGGSQGAAAFAADLAAHPGTAWTSLHALAALGPDGIAAMPTWTALLADSDWFVRRAAAEALGAIGPRASAAVPDLIKALDTVDIDEFAVIRALVDIGDPSAAPVLARSARTSHDERVPPLARRGLRSMGLDPDAVVPAPGKPKGRPPQEDGGALALLAASARAPSAQVAAAPRLPFANAFLLPGAGGCGSVAAHPRGLLGADYCRDGDVAIVEATSGRRIAKLERPDAPSGDEHFGTDIAVMGTTALVAVPLFGGPAVKCGAVYAFPEAGPPSRIDNPWPAFEGAFGRDLAAGTDYFVSRIGSREEAPNGAIVVLSATGRLLSTIVDLPEGAAPYGGSLAVHGDLIAYGEPRIDGDKQPGEVLLYERPTGKLLRALRGPSPADDDVYGRRIAFLDDSRLLMSSSEGIHIMEVATGTLVATVGDPDPRGDADSFPEAFTPIDAHRFAASAGGMGRREVYVFDDNGKLLSVAVLPIEDPEALACDFGSSMAAGGGRLFVGAEVDGAWLEAWRTAAPGSAPPFRDGMDSSFFAFDVGASR